MVGLEDQQMPLRVMRVYVEFSRAAMIMWYHCASISEHCKLGLYNTLRGMQGIA